MTDQKKQEPAGRPSALGSAAQTKDWQSMSQRSLWEVLLFFLISIGVLQLRGHDLLASAPADFREVLGYPPPAHLVTVALAVYCFSACLIILTQMANSAAPVIKWTHLGYRSAFYFFYAASGSLVSHFMAVFYIGIFLYGAEQLHVWVYGNGAKHRKKELFGEQ